MKATKAREMTGYAMKGEEAEREERAKMGSRVWGRGRGWTAFCVVVRVVRGVGGRVRERKEAAGGGQRWTSR